MKKKKEENEFSVLERRTVKDIEAEVSKRWKKFIFVPFLFFYLCLQFFTIVFEGLENGLRFNWKGFYNPFYFLPLSGGVTVLSIVCGILFFAECYYGYKNAVLKKTNSLESSKGTSSFGTVEETNERISDPDKEFNMPLSRHLRLAVDQRISHMFPSVLVSAPPGAGKTRTMLKPNVLEMNTNYLITDPSGDILEDLGSVLERNGYIVKVFDVSTRERCNTYNPLSYCKTEDDVRKLADTLLASFNNGNASKDPYWDDAFKQLVCALASFLISPYVNDASITAGRTFMPCLASLAQMLPLISELEEGEEVGEGELAAQHSVINAIFERIREKEMGKPKPYCLSAWENFRTNAGETLNAVLSTVSVKLDVFNIPKIRNLTSTNNIALEELADRPCALFIITPPNNRTYDFLISLLTTQATETLFYRAQHSYNEQRVMAGKRLLYNFPADSPEAQAYLEKCKTATSKYNKERRTTEIIASDGTVITSVVEKNDVEKRLRDVRNAKITYGDGVRLAWHCRFLLDEFMIVSVPDFENTLATARKHEVSFVLIVQAIEQLKRKYEKSYTEIDQNCPIMISMGGSSTENNKYISEKLGEIAQKTSNTSFAEKNSVSGSTEKTALLSSAEIAMIGRLGEDADKGLGKILILITGFKPVLDDKYDLTKHRYYGYTLGANKENHFDRDAYTITEISETIISADLLGDTPFTIEANASNLIQMSLMSYNEEEQEEKIITATENTLNFMFGSTAIDWAN